MEVEKIVYDIFTKRTGIDFEKNHMLRDAPLFGEEIQLLARDLLLIYSDIEATLKVSIPKNEILKGNFNTFENILRIVKNIPK